MLFNSVKYMERAIEVLFSIIIALSNIKFYIKEAFFYLREK